MPKKVRHCILIDPTKACHRDIIQLIYQCHFYPAPTPNILYSLTPVRLKDASGQRINVYLTHDIFPFIKQPPTTANYLMTTDLENSTFGGYGGTADIYNSWKLTQDAPAEFKIKPRHKKRMLKLSNATRMPDKEKQYFYLEQIIGKYTPHMGTNHPINEISDKLILLMRKQPGITLKSVIEQSDATPNSLRAIDYLKLTVNLLIALKTQVHSIEIADEGHIIHGDIKPHNIMVSKRYHVKVIDYGLASTEKNRHTDITGTRGYIDPYYYSNPKEPCDELSDLASIGISLQRLWMISNYCMKNIIDLTISEKDWIQWLLLNMTEKDRQQRISYEALLNQFKGLLKTKKTEYKAYLKSIKTFCDHEDFFNLLVTTHQHATSRGLSAGSSEHLCIMDPADKPRGVEARVAPGQLHLLNNDQLLDLLKSKYAHSILGKAHSNPSRLPDLVKRLNINLLELSSKTLNWLKKKGMVIPEDSRMIQTCLDKQVEVSALKKAIKLGAKIYEEDLIFWLEKTPLLKPQYGIAVLRLLYEHMPKEARDRAYLRAKMQPPFFTDFYRLLLKTPRQYDCNTEVRLINYHRELLDLWRISTARTIRVIQNEPKRKAMPICTHITDYIYNPPLLFAVEQIEECLIWQRDFERYLRYRLALEAALVARVLPKVAAARGASLKTIAIEFNNITGSKPDEWQEQLNGFRKNRPRYKAILNIEKAFQRKVRHLCERDISFSPEDIANFNDAYTSGNDSLVTKHKLGFFQPHNNQHSPLQHSPYNTCSKT